MLHDTVVNGELGAEKTYTKAISRPNVDASRALCVLVILLAFGVQKDTVTPCVRVFE